ncbi:hypothetical protein F4553_002181 [Allocatelliglobosispora scoriae]|uniref:Winged helix DNA-binding domain-containing protein n=1 Tax=Allocatelliglobosispora scoriae TaxID=643052 RepID=A0A841BPX4_9ACTN|nr:winged helix DNA-binding domain-containing protein [Allocatelliglobosispora scoriae]MBB5868802.1 hypothetical protein [Allocatelliglobosispora scoriae]
MSEIAARRMHRQHLWGPALASIDDVVRDFGAMQAQEFLPAKWSIAQRAAGITDSDVDAAFAAGTLLRTHVLRPTWHFVHTADIRWILAASAPRVHAVNGYYYRKTGVDDEAAARGRAVFARVLADGRQLTRAELAGHLAAAGMPLTGVPLAYMIIHAELEGMLVSGAMRGKQHTYALLDSRTSAAPPPDREEALAMLTRRYFACHGPATIKDYCTWASLTAGEARRSVASLGTEVRTEVVGERTYLFVPGASPPAAPPASPVIDLLQDYDEYVFGYLDSRDVMLRRGGPELPMPSRPRALLLDGVALGFWQHTATKSAVEVSTVLPRRLTAPESAAMQRAADRFGAFLGLPAAWH